MSRLVNLSDFEFLVVFSYFLVTETTERVEKIIGGKIFLSTLAESTIIFSCFDFVGVGFKF